MTYNIHSLFFNTLFISKHINNDGKKQKSKFIHKKYMDKNIIIFSI